MHTRTFALAALIGTAMLGLGGCAADDTVRLEEVSKIRYTGDAQTDLVSLCKIGSLVNGLDNTQNKIVQDTVLGVSESFADTSDPTVSNVLKGLEFLTSTDQGIRAEGEKILDSACDSF